MVHENKGCCIECCQPKPPEAGTIAGRQLPLAHTSCARSLQQGLPAYLLHDPPECTAIRRLPVSAVVADSIIVADEPLVITGAAKDWPAAVKWSSPAALRQHYGHLTFSLSTDLTGVSLAQFLDYTASCDSDFPQYIAERNFSTGGREDLLQDFTAPDWFDKNLLSQVQDLPSGFPYWLLGSACTGTQLHTDEGCTSGWNVCLCGSKRWCMMPPETDTEALGLNSVPEGPACWFVDTLPTLQQAAAEGKLRLYETVQRPGEMVIIPGGWHHAIINIEFSCAVAQTVIIPAALPHLWPSIRHNDLPFAHASLDLADYLHADLDLKETIRGVVRDGAASGSKHLSLKWRIVDSSQQTTAPMQHTLFVDCLWLSRRIGARPDASSIFSQSVGAMRPALMLKAIADYHSCLLSLAGEVQSMQATLCIVCEVTTERSQLTAALEEHGLSAAAWILEEEIDSWIEQQRVQVCGRLREDNVSCHVVESYLVSYLMMPSATHSFCRSVCRALYAKPHSLQYVVYPPVDSNSLPAQASATAVYCSQCRWQRVSLPMTLPQT